MESKLNDTEKRCTSLTSDRQTANTTWAEEIAKMEQAVVDGAKDEKTAWDVAESARELLSN